MTARLEKYLSVRLSATLSLALGDRTLATSRSAPTMSGWPNKRARAYLGGDPPGHAAGGGAGALFDLDEDQVAGQGRRVGGGRAAVLVDYKGEVRRVWSMWR